MKQKNLIITIGIVVVVAAVAFFGGMQFQKTQRTQIGNFAGGQGNFQGRLGQGGGTGEPTRRFGGTGGGAVVGEIIAADDKSITVKLSDGSSKIVLLSSSTTINKADTATKSDLKTGVQVAAFGAANSDGSVTAQSIQLNPMMRMGGQPTNTPKK